MNLTELQVQLKNVENEISQLSAEIEKMKPEKQVSKIDYVTITRVAKQYPINELDICHAPEQMRKVFVTMLMYLFVADDNGLTERLLYLTRFAAGCKLQMSAKDVYQSALAIEMDDVERLSSELADYRYSFVIEAYVVANLSVGMDKNAWTLLADIAQLMKCDVEEIIVLSHVAKYKLTGDTRHLDEIPLPKTNRWSGKLRDYIPREWIQKKRQRCVQISLLKGNKLLGDENKGKSCVESLVKNGELVCSERNILTYKELLEPADMFYYLHVNTSKEDVWEKHIIKAMSNGMVFSVEYSMSKKSEPMWYRGGLAIPEDTYLEVYIVSPFDDYDSFKSWMDNR